MARMRDGTLERIYREWSIWDEHQPAFFAPVLAGGRQPAMSSGSAQTAAAPRRSMLSLTLSYLPALLRASLITILLSCLAMGLAVFAGVFIASGRVYGNVLVRSLLTIYVEVVSRDLTSTLPYTRPLA